MNKNKSYGNIISTQELKAHLEDNNKARMYEEKKKQDKWDKLETKIWRVVLFKEDKEGSQKFYEYNGDHSCIAEQMSDVDNEDLNEITDIERLNQL